MKLRNRIIPLFLAVAVVSGGVAGAAHVEQSPAEGRDEVGFRPWIGTLGIRFHSENLFDEAVPSLFSGILGTTEELSGQAGTTGLQGLGLGGEWRPFRNGFRLNFAMYFDSIEPDEPGGLRPRPLSAGFGADTEEHISLTRDLEAIPYVGLGWRTNDGGLDVNLDVGAFLPGNRSYSLRDLICLDPGSSLAKCGAASFANSQNRLSGTYRKFEWYPVVSLGITYRF